MERIAQGRSSTLTHTFYVDGTPTDPSPDTATVSIKRADGTTLVPAGSVTEAGTGVVTLTLTPAETALLDVLTVTWSATFGGQSQAFVDYVEIVGDFLFTLSELSAIKPGNATWTTAQMVAKRTVVEQTLEDACARAFVPRYKRETLSGTGTTTLVLSQPDIRTIRSVTVNGTAYSGAQLAGLAFNASGILTNTSYWPCGASNITIAYEHGTDTAPMRVSQAALLLARSLLVTGPVDNRALGQASPTGDFSFGLAVPGRNGSWVGLPEVDAVIDQYSLRVGVA